MDENMQRLIQGLRAEKCPVRVFEGVARRLARRPPPPRRFLTASAVAAVCIVALLAAVTLWPRPNRDAVRPSEAFVPNRAQQARVAGEAVAALGYIGNALLEAGQHTQSTLLNEAVPPLRSRLEAAGRILQNKI